MSIDIGKSLTDKIRRKEARIGVIGLGYVGLPLAVEFAEAGYAVIGIDKDPDKIDILKEGKSYITDIKADVIAKLISQDKLTVTQDYSQIKNLDAISICVPTPLRKTLSYLEVSLKN